jgi:hypothetical protein
MSAKLLVAAAASVQLSGGDRSGPSQVYFFGIVPPVENAEVEI